MFKLPKINFPGAGRHLAVQQNGESKNPPGPSVQNIIAPKKIDVDFNFIKINNKYLSTLFVAGYPRFVSPGWLDPLINFDHSLDLSFFIYPVEGKTVLDDLRRKIAEMEAEIATDLQRGRIVNPGTQAKLEDAGNLQEQLVKGAERFFQFAFYITIPADSLEELNNTTQQILSTLGSLLVVAKTATLQMEDGLYSTLPLGTDKLSITRNMDTTSLATTFPFTSGELSSDRGVLYGINEDNDSLVVFDRFTLENYNSVIFATSGAGKSISYNDPVLYKDPSGFIRLDKIGAVVEKAIQQGKFKKLDDEMEGVLEPGIEVFAFDRFLRGRWSKVSVAARKTSPKALYKIRTKSGREVTVTSDHNLIILKNGRLSTLKGSAVETGNYIPLPRNVSAQSARPKHLDIKVLLSKSKIKFLSVRGGRVGNRLATPGTSLPKTLVLTNQFFRLLGYFASEGMITSQRALVTSCIPAILNDLGSYYKSIGVKYSLLAPQAKITGIHVHAEPFRELLRLLGSAGKAGKKNVPPLVFAASISSVASFLKAYFEGDGGVESHQITATTKSRQLASGLSYLLLRFGIVARITRTRKIATNGKMKQKATYYKIAISGQDNIVKFIKDIGFVSGRKNAKAKTLLKKANTNVDVIPGLGSILSEVYMELYSSTEIPAPKKFSEIKLGIFKPSRRELLRLIKEIELRIQEIEHLEGDGLATLASLPTLNQILEKGDNRVLNGKLWQKLGSSWPVMRKGQHPPLLKGALAAAGITHEEDFEMETVSSSLYRSFKVLGESLRTFDPSLWSATVNRSGNTSYLRLLAARDYLSQAYKKKKEKLARVKEHLIWLKILATSNLFWDPVVEVKKIKAKHRFVYDLTVDDQVFLAGFGGVFVHNSFAVKLEAIRSLMLGTEVFIIDPEAEYKALAQAAGGEFISFSFGSPAKINPFDLSTIQEEENQLGLKILSLHSLFGVIMGQLNPTEQAILDRALIETYRAKGITLDPQTQKLTPPLMEDLYKSLLGMEEPLARGLADRIEKFVKGSFQGIFDQHTNIDLKNPFTVFSVRDLEESLRPIAMFIILDFIWTRIRRDIKKRLLIVDEAWHMMRYPDTAQFLYSIAKRSRKYYLGLTTITQDVEDFLSRDIGKAIVTNSALRLLMKQSAAAIDSVGDVFKISEGEKQLLLAADIGEGIFFAGSNHVAIRVVASEEEYKLVTSKPSDILAAQKAQATQPAQSTPQQEPPRATPKFVVEEIT